jgi:hypothetical protein
MLPGTVPALRASTMRARINLRTYVWAAASASAAVLLFVFPGAAHADAEDAEARVEDPRGRIRLGVGGGASWLPVQGGTSTAVAEAFLGIDEGIFSVRVSPRFQYAAMSAYPSSSFSLAYLAIEGALRPAPWYEVSAAPLVGYTWASTLPPCSDVCTEVPYTTGVTFGGTVSPATLVFGKDKSVAAGVHVSLLEYQDTGHVYLGSYLDLRWFFHDLAPAH